MRSRQRALNVIAVPAGERQAPGWVALHPDQFATEVERHAAHGRWHCLSSANGRVYRALQFREDLPADGIALDWAARSILEGDRRGEVAESQTLQLGLRRARLTEYPRCLFQHPNPTVRLAAAGLMVVVLAAGTVCGIVLSSNWRAPSMGSAPVETETALAVPAGPRTFIQLFVGEWQGPDEQLLIKNDKGVIEVLRQTRLESDKVQLDQYVGAPVRVDTGQKRLLLETPAGLWQLVLLPGSHRAQLSITYPDNRNVLYQ